MLPATVGQGWEGGELVGLAPVDDDRDAIEVTDETISDGLVDLGIVLPPHVVEAVGRTHFEHYNPLTDGDFHLRGARLDLTFDPRKDEIAVALQPFPIWIRVSQISAIHTVATAHTVNLCCTPVHIVLIPTHAPVSPDCFRGNTNTMGFFGAIGRPVKRVSKAPRLDFSLSICHLVPPYSWVKILSWCCFW